MTTSIFRKVLMVGLVAALPATTFAGELDSFFHGTRPSIEGVWDSTVTLQVCGGGAIIRTFRALNLFEDDGSLVATSEAVPPPSLGRWRWLGGSTYRAQFQYLRLGAGGVFEGMTRVTRQIQMAPDGKSFTSVVSTQFFDVANTLFAEGCGKESATRVF
ncbi:MAG TPA: hypothetical protein VGQ22_06745 [Steroidobacteraceae bacterium]|jgi:hypothetical protein|nr:hypothetical protein [Steroidobacteraceae bacterium]